MKIESIEIQRFGIFQHQGLSALSPGLTLISAANGGGKTTLRTFLRAALFGFERSEDNKYLLDSQPHIGHINFRVNNANFAGSTFRLSFDAQNNKRSVARLGGGSTPELASLLGSASSQLYRNIFAIGLTELQQAKQLDDKQVQTLIGAVGSGRSGQVFQDAYKAIAAERDEVFKPGGSKPTANAKLSEITALQDRIKLLRADSENYWRVLARLRELDADIQAAGAAEQEARSENEHCATLNKAWPVFLDWANSEKGLEALRPLVESFPDGGLEKLRAHDAARCALEAEVEANTEKLTKVELELQQLLLSPELVLCSAEIDDLVAHNAVNDSQREALQQATVGHDLLTANLAAELTALGHWSAEQLNAFDSTVQSNAERLRTGRLFNEAARAAAECATQYERIQNDADRKKSFAEATDQKFATQWPQAPPTHKDLDTRERALTQISASLADSARLTDKSAAAEREAVEAERQATVFSERLEGHTNLTAAANSVVPPKVTPYRPFAWLALLGAAVAASFAYRHLLVLAALMVVAGIVFAVLWNYKSEALYLPSPIGETSADFFEAQVKYWREKQAVAAAMCLTLAEQQKAAEVALQQLYRAFGETPTNAAACAAARAKLDAARALAREAEAQQHELTRLREAAGASAQEAVQARENLDRLNADLKAKAADWGDWLKKHGLAADTATDVAEMVCARVQGAQEIFRQIELTLSEVGRGTRLIGEYETVVAALFGRLQRPLPDAPLGLTLRRLADERDVARTNALRRDNLQNILLDLRETQGKKRAELEKCVSERQSLLSAGGALDAAEFEIRCASWKQQGALLSKMANAGNGLEALSAPGESVARLRHELAGLDFETLNSRSSATVAKLEAAKVTYTGLVGERGKCQRERELLENSDTLAQENTALAGSLAELNDLAEDWALHKLAGWLMDRARNKYETERQPAVLQSASKYLGTMTGGSVTRIIKTLDTQRYRLSMREGDDKEGEEIWNTALREQTFLALRFGLIDAYCNQSEPLPIILDDALVNLDPANLQGAVRCIAELAERHQVIYLTCHPDTEKCFASLLQPPTTYRILDGAFVQA